jgi:hypothetical protein
LKLPELVSGASLLGRTEDERDLLLISTIGALSGCLANFGNYHGDKVYPNLFIVVIAPAGSGKGIMRHSKRIVDKYNEYVKTTSSKKSRVIIPGNSSSAAIYDALNLNGGAGLIFETEVDTLSAALKQDWGGFSDVLRKAFHHESTTLNRKGDPKLIDITQPRLAMVLSGTPQQLYPLVDSVENGLFSRVTFMTLPSSMIWKDVSPAGQNSRDSEVEALADRFLEALVFNESHPFEMTLSLDQWARLNAKFKGLLEGMAGAQLDLAASIKRLALMTFKICIILTSMRRFQANSQAPQEQCGEEDFEIALELADSLFRNIEVVHSMFRQAKPKVSNSPMFKLFEKLPDEFTREQALVIGAALAQKPRTVDKYLALLFPKYLEKSKPGFYRKTQSGIN